MTLTAENPKETFLTDYLPPAYLIDSVDLHFSLTAAETRVQSRLAVRKNRQGPDGALVLDGEQQQLISVSINGKQLRGNEYQHSPTSLLIADVPDSFELEIETIIHPDKNTALEGLYHSGSLLCTQCEAQGFRRITYYLDRPDVLAKFTTTLVADKKKWPVLLSNGNLVDKGDGEEGQHWVKWHDPHPKPSYLFALVAGDLSCQRDHFVTRSGRDVKLEIYVDPENSQKCDHALTSLKQAMRWDEENYGREYDLDIFMIVAVNDFNMGAMENKGLNIFNASCVLASPETATDADYQTIQGIVGHEYFHNWSGNRVTCRDWFQLSLKEGFTVFRDQQFSAAMNSAAVQRIEDVDKLRTLQFVEDAGPMAHPVRPASFVEINNFYTVTIYEKGAEVVGMIKTIVGDDGFRRGTDLYFDRHDGQAVTTDDFVKAIEDANSCDLTQFKLWYSQAGTPELNIEGEYDPNQRSFTLTIEQSCPATPDQIEKKPFHIPFSVGLLDKNGMALPLQLEGEQSTDKTTELLTLKEARHQFRFDNVQLEPVLSLSRGFSAPVKLIMKRDNDTLAFLMAHDTDSFSRWDAGQTLLTNLLVKLVEDIQQGRELAISDKLISQFGKILDNADSDPALTVKLLLLPGENYLAAQCQPVDVDAIHTARAFLRQALAAALAERFATIYSRYSQKDPYLFSADEVAKRSLKNICLSYLTSNHDPMQIQRCLRQMKQADNMTDVLAPLRLVANYPGPEREIALRSFYEKWQNDRQVVDKWLAVQATSTLPDTLLRIKTLMKHQSFNIKNPNNVRALIGQFCRNNPVNFHAKDGSGYRFLADQIIALDKINPQVASRQLGALSSWRRYDKTRQEMMKKTLQRIAATEQLSSDVHEIMNKYLAEV